MKKRILFVDDERDILDCYKNFMFPQKPPAADFLRMLSEETPTRAPECTYDCVFVEQGIDGINKIKEGHETGRPFSIVFLDMYMPPGIHGLDTAQKIRKFDSNVVICMVSAAAECTYAAAHQATGDENVIVLRKPFFSEDIHGILESIFSGDTRKP